jgi:antitoxin (DNA-binding transcriptional repressor) of toxin-antitoxin stability system
MIVSKGELKAKMLEYFRKVEKTGEELIVTDNRIPVLKVLPIKKKKNVEEVFAKIQGKVKYNEDILTPETEEWGDV